MDRSELQNLLAPIEPQESGSLPDSFGGDVLQRGKRLRNLVKQHWQWLRWASLISLAIAVILGLILSLSAPTDAPPPMHLFHENSGTVPFSTK